MKVKILLSLLISLTIASISFCPGYFFFEWRYSVYHRRYNAGGENAGILESTINADTNATGARVNPNRVYALNEGQVYYQLAPI